LILFQIGHNNKFKLTASLPVGISNNDYIQGAVYLKKNMGKSRKRCFNMSHASHA